MGEVTGKVGESLGSDGFAAGASIVRWQPGLQARPHEGMAENEREKEETPERGITSVRSRLRRRQAIRTINKLSVKP